MVPVTTNRNINNSPTQPGMLIHPLAPTAFQRSAQRSALSAQPMAFLTTVMGRNATAMLLGLGAMMRN